ncbi:MAG: DoxX family membrane protein, partial [Verrucomicrobiales bacterium]|nr:DoxX family membrane protein [Verrucomicrobiales bacterium]
LIIRIITVAIFFYYQHVAQMALGIDFVWDAGEWDLVTQLTDRGLPSPAVLALVSVAVLTISLLGLVLGIFTRINALILALFVGFILLAPIILSATLNPQALTLYLGLFIGLALGGGGRLSLDYALANRRERRRKPL